MGGNSGENRERRGQSGRNGDGGAGRTDSDRQSEDGGPGRRQETSTAEKAVMVLSVAFTVLLFAYAGWQMVTPPAMDAPAASVAGTERMENGSVAVTVQLRTPKDISLVRATVESNCTSPPVQAEFSYVPSSTSRTATLVCPPGTTDPSVSVTNWVTR